MQSIIHVVRHGETLLNRERRYQGHVDSPLTDKGVMQAELIADYLSGEAIRRVYSSDLGRVLSTAEPTASRLGVKITPDQRLRELSFGALEGLTYDEALQTHGEFLRTWYSNPEFQPPPQGETLGELKQRVLSFMSDLLEEAVPQVAVFTHGGVCNLLYALSNNARFGESHWSKPGNVYTYSATLQSRNSIKLLLAKTMEWEDEQK